MPVIALFLEALLLIPTLIVIGAGLSASPQGRQFLELLADQVPWSSASLRERVRDLLLQPWVILITLGYIAVLVPLLEEAVKTLAIWPLLRRKLTTAEAFIGGALAGAGYALFEALFMTQPGADWTAAAIGRGGATLMHAFTAGLSSWGLATAVASRRWSRLALAYFVAVAIHGLWNASAIGISLAALAGETGESVLNPNLLRFLGAIGPAILFGLSLTAWVGLPWLAKALVRQADAHSDG
jgi:hypothetical protein